MAVTSILLLHGLIVKLIRDSAKMTSLFTTNKVITHNVSMDTNDQQVFQGMLWIS